MADSKTQKIEALRNLQVERKLLPDEPDDVEGNRIVPKGEKLTLPAAVAERFVAKGVAKKL